MSIKVDDPNFWSKHGLPSKTVKDSSFEYFTSMWISTHRRGKDVYTLTPKSNYTVETQMRNIGRRIVYEVVQLKKTTFCPTSDESEDEDYTGLHNQIEHKLTRKTNEITDLILTTNAEGNEYNGITIMEEDTDKEDNKLWYISYVCVATGTKGVGSKMIQQIKSKADKDPDLLYVFLETIPSAREFYKKQGFVHVYRRHNEVEPVCLKEVPMPKIDTPGYNYDKYDLMVYCPTNNKHLTSKKQESKFKVGETVLYNNTRIIIKEIIGETILAEYNGNMRRLLISDIQKLPPQEKFKENQVVRLKEDVGSHNTAIIEKGTEAKIIDIDDNGQYLIESLVDGVTLLADGSQLEQVRRGGKTRRIKKNQKKTRRN